jgi:hypothetical protein
MSGLRPSTSGTHGQLKDEEIRETSAAMEGIKFLPEYFGENGNKTRGLAKYFINILPKVSFRFLAVE